MNIWILMRSPVFGFRKQKKKYSISMFIFFMTMDLLLSIQQRRWSIRGKLPLYSLISFPRILLLRIHFNRKRTKIEAESQMGDCIFQSHWSKLIWSQLFCYVDVLDGIQIWANHAYPTSPILLIAGKRCRVEITWANKILNRIREKDNIQ